MKKLLLLFLLLAARSAFTQTLWFQMQRINYCTKKTVIDSSLFYLVDKYGTGYKNVAGKVWLNEKGEYTIFNPANPNEEFPRILITDNEHIYTHKESKIRFAPQYWGLSFQSCEGLLNGSHEDVYDNGNLRIRGNFVNGLPKDSLVLFYANGNTQKNIYYLRSHVCIQEYDSTGNLIKINSNSNRLPVITDYESTTFYSNGSIKSIEKRKKGYLQLTEYYPDKRLKTQLSKKKRIEYHPNGRPATVYTWKEKLKGSASVSSTKYQIVKTSFNAEGYKTEEIKYHSFQGNKQPTLVFKPADFVVYWKKILPDGTEQLVLKNKTKYEAALEGLSPQ